VPWDRGDAPAVLENTANARAAIMQCMTLINIDLDIELKGYGVRDLVATDM
jgi:hypothetical protein